MGSIGFACHIVGVPHLKMRRCILRNANQAKLVEISKHNLTCLEMMVDYCFSNSIKMMRIGSDIIPFASHKGVEFDWKRIFASRIRHIGNRIRQTELRVSMHPGQYTVLNSPREDVVCASVDNIMWHADFLDLLGVDYTAKIVLHIGGVYEDKASSMTRFIQNFESLPENVRRRIILENDEKNYNIEDVVSISRQLDVPAVIDVFHHELLSPKEKDVIYWIKEAGSTWKQGDGAQKIHYSQQQIGGRSGAHSDTINVEQFMAFYRRVSDMNIDIMLEVKDKNVSAIKCINAVMGT